MNVSLIDILNRVLYLENHVLYRDIANNLGSTAVIFNMPSGTISIGEGVGSLAFSIYAKDSSTGKGVSLGVGTGRANHGIYSPSNGAWISYKG